MNSRDKILEALHRNQPPAVPLPAVNLPHTGQDWAALYRDTLMSVGGKAMHVDTFEAVVALVGEQFKTSKRIVTTVARLAGAFESVDPSADPHSLDNVELAIIPGAFGVAENGAVWVTEEDIVQRVLPFICQHLAVIVDAAAIVPSMHEAYQRIGSAETGYGVFIAGPSKTADIEQSLVLGAHGPMSMTVFLMGSQDLK